MTSERASAESALSAPAEVRRLNWGCGEHPEPGWLNSDVKDVPGIDIVADLRTGLPLATDSIDYITSIHALPELPYPDLVPALTELRRVLKPGGVLRLALPDLERGIAAYERGDLDYFHVPDEDARSIGAKFVTQMTWYGYSRSLFVHDFVEELLQRAGFARVDRCRYRQTASPWPDIVALDNRERESLFMEGVK
ncbi:MAG: class I SAM-dependent methyltransferase [Solirubrobacterales bacterium]